MIRHQFGQVQHASEQWFRLAATILAGANRMAAIATPAKPRAAHVRRIDLVSISERLASLIIVFREGALRQVLVNLAEPAEQEDLTRAAVILDGLMAGRTAVDAERALARIDGAGPIGTLVQRVGERVVAAVREYDATLIEEVFSDGLLHVMEAPGVRAERQAPAGLRGPREPGLSRPAVRLDRGNRPRPGLHRRRERAGGDARRLARPRLVRRARPRPSASSASSARPGWPIPRRSARSDSCRA